jgi:GTP-binding protein LepA
MEFNIIDYRASDLVRMDVKINYEDAPPLACITHRDKAQTLGRKLCTALKEHIPRQMFKIPIQACIGVKVIASESINPMRKDGACCVALRCVHVPEYYCGLNNYFPTCCSVGQVLW